MPIDSLEIVQIEVNDWPKAVKWYTDVLSLEVAMKEDDDKIAFLKFPKGEGKIALFGCDATATSKNRAYPCILVTDLDGTIKSLKKKGVEFEEEGMGGADKGFRAAKLWDLERNTLFIFEWSRPG
ncbi:MAG: hypothetical protein EOO73_05490 [Myxococcales bacterium]|nr:MAG: hypothetical protein EOO73_05490 [Myxococcales bacterium]